MRDFKYLLFILFLLPLGDSNGQTFLEAGYLGENITHPGVYGTISRPIGTDFRAGVTAASYFHRRMHTGLTIQPQVEWLKTRPSGFQFGVSLGAGYLRTFIPGTYELQGETFEKISATGTNHFTLSPAIRLGKDLEPKTGLPIELVFRNQLMYILPWFEGSSNTFNFMAGLTYRFNKQ